MFAVSTFATARLMDVMTDDKPADSTVTFQFLDGDFGGGRVFESRRSRHFLGPFVRGADLFPTRFDLPSLAVFS